MVRAHAVAANLQGLFNDFDVFRTDHCWRVVVLGGRVCSVLAIRPSILLVGYPVPCLRIGGIGFFGLSSAPMARALTVTPDRLPGTRAGDRTILFYDGDPDAYSRGTLNNDMSDLYPAFLERVQPGGLVLDAGSGSGRDIREFLARGYRVEAFDASTGMARLASQLTGVDVKVARFEDWSSQPAKYDGIWCFASLLHVARKDLPVVIARLAETLRPGAPLFASFKQGCDDVVDERGRHYTNLTIETAGQLFRSDPKLDLLHVWQDDGPTGLGGPTRWVYVLAVGTV